MEFLGIDAGGSRTVAIVINSQGEILRRSEFGPGNIRLLSDQDLVNLFAQIAQVCAAPAAIGAGIAGLRDSADHKRAARAFESVWGSVPTDITHDLDIALAAADEPADAPQVLVLSGTGSCCFGRGPRGTAKVGGWGHLLGDIGSGYDIAHKALREIVYDYDRFGKWSSLGDKILSTLLLNQPNDLIAWMQSASKSDVAALGKKVFESKTDPIARRVLRQTAESLCSDAVICAKRIAAPKSEVRFVFAGSVLLRQPQFSKTISNKIRKVWPKSSFKSLSHEAAWGAAQLARKAAAATALPKPSSSRVTAAPAATYYFPEFNPATSPTEQRNPASMRFHQLTTAKMVGVMLEAEQAVIPALHRVRPQITRAVDLAANTLRAEGRIFYVGAGTSGRLGVLDASECPPTFRASPEMIQGIIAGGQRALWQAVEGAEDDAAAGATALRYRELTGRDLVIGIAASGRTPFVWGALGFARKSSARTILLCFNPSLKIDRTERPDLVIAPDLGPEILTGSTRLKSGTATKLILNMISTIAMVRLGKVIGNLMVDLNPSNVKLRDRAIRILQELTGADAAKAKGALEQTQWVVKDAWQILRARPTR